jgi:integrase
MIALESKAHHRSVNWASFAEFMLQTGMRTGEVRAARWTDIDEKRILVHGNYTLSHGYKNSTKTNKKRWVPINSKAREVLDSTDKTSEFIFPWNRYAFQTYFRLKVDQLYDAGLVKHKYRPYDLRHVAISRWLEAGIPVTQAAQWAGNTSEVIWKHYAAGRSPDHRASRRIRSPQTPSAPRPSRICRAANPTSSRCTRVCRR